MITCKETQRCSMKAKKLTGRRIICLIYFTVIKIFDGQVKNNE